MINHQEPQTYLCRTANLDSNNPIFKLSQTLNPGATSASNSIDLKSRAGMPFKVIAKNREWAQDFWNGLVGPTLKEDMDVETWIRGPIPPISDTDGIHKTYDIKYINLGPLGIHMAWPETHDHAKWGITTHSNWVCVADINRMISQRKRGGGTIAFQNETLWRGLSKTDLLLAPSGLTRDQARSIIHDTHYDPREPEASSPPPKIASMAYKLPRKPALYRGKVTPTTVSQKTPSRRAKSHK
jgi:deoxyribonuclease-2